MVLPDLPLPQEDGVSPLGGSCLNRNAGGRLLAFERTKVSPESTAKDYMLYVYAGTWGRAGILRVTEPESKTLAEREVSGSFGGQLQRVRVTTSSAGEYEISFTIPGSGPKGGRASCDAYFVPFSEVFDDALH
jgi:hypothetical protein